MSKKHGIISFLIVLSCSFLVRETSGNVLQEALDVIHIAKDVVVAIAKAWNIVDQHVDFSDIPIPILDKTESKLFGKIGVITSKLDRLSGQVDAVGTNTIASVLQILPDRIRLELRLNNLVDYLTRMDVLNRNFQNYVKNKKSFERLTLEDFAKSVVSHDSSSVISLVERIHAFVAPTERGITDNGLMKTLVRSLEENSNEDFAPVIFYSRRLHIIKKTTYAKRIVTPSITNPKEGRKMVLFLPTGGK